MRPLLTRSLTALAAVLALCGPASAQSADAPPAPPIPSFRGPMPDTGDWRALLSEMRSATAELRETVVLAQNERGKLDATIRVAQASTTATPSATILPPAPAAPAPPAAPALPSPQQAPAITPSAQESPALTPVPTAIQAATTPYARRPGPLRQLVALTGDGLVGLGNALGHAGDTRIVQRIPRAPRAPRYVRTVAAPAPAPLPAAPQQAAVTPSAQR